MDARVRRPLAIGTAVIIVLAGSFVAFRFLGASQVPKEFRDARDEGGVISERIVENAKSVTESLNQVSSLEAQKQYGEEDAKINDLEKQNQAMKDDALALSKQMEIMLNIIPEIRSEKARDTAFQAVNSELAVITNLLSYGDFMERLFGVLRERTVKNRAAQIDGWLHEINNEVQQINDYNAKARDAFTQFDSITK